MSWETGDRHQTIWMSQVLPVLIVSVHNERVLSAQLCSQTRFTSPGAPGVDLSSQDPNSAVMSGAGSYRTFSPNLQLLPLPLVPVSWMGPCLMLASWTCGVKQRGAHRLRRGLTERRARLHNSNS